MLQEVVFIGQNSELKGATGARTSKIDFTNYQIDWIGWFSGIYFFAMKVPISMEYIVYFIELGYKLMTHMSSLKTKIIHSNLRTQLPAYQPIYLRTHGLLSYLCHHADLLA